jgi:hypothetical protein
MVNPEERALDAFGAGKNFGYGNTGSDKMYGTDDIDNMWGDTKGTTFAPADAVPAAFDKYDTEGGDDWLQGFAGPDVLYGQYGNDKIEGGDDDDALIGDMGDDKVFGGDGNDVIWGDDKASTLVPVVD